MVLVNHDNKALFWLEFLFVRMFLICIYQFAYMNTLIMLTAWHSLGR